MRCSFLRCLKWCYLDPIKITKKHLIKFKKMVLSNYLIEMCDFFFLYIYHYCGTVEGGPLK